MDIEIQKILEDIYRMDPSLKNKESEIVKVIDELVAAKPDTKFDENFKQQLRAKIMQKISAMPPKKISHGWFTVPKFAYAMGGLAILALVILPSLYFYGNKTPNAALSVLTSKSSSGVSVTKLAGNAFGALTAGQSNTAAEKTGSQSLAATAPSAVNTNDLAVSYPAPNTPSAGSGSVVAGSAGSGVSGVAASPTMMPIRATNYKFVYKGSDLPQLSDNMDVLKRVTDGGAASLSTVMANTGLNFIDWTKFSNTKLQNISFTENRDNGYQVYVNFDDGSVSISQNAQWVASGNGTTISSCMGTGCVPSPIQPIKIGDVPSDSKLIDVANGFLHDYGISLVNYGQPYVQNDWRIQYEATTDKANYWIPQSFSVIYPLMINGKEVYDESGNKTGLTVNVDITQMKATGVYNLMTQNYQSSSYPTENDSARIIKLAENGGFRQIYYWYGGNGESQEIDLGTPVLGLVQMWFYRDNQNQQMLVPSYIFPVTNKAAGAYYYQNSVVVPVIKDVLDWGNSSGGGVVPMMTGGVQAETAPATPPAVQPAPAVK